MLLLASDLPEQGILCNFTGVPCNSWWRQFFNVHVSIMGRRNGREWGPFPPALSVCVLLGWSLPYTICLFCFVVWLWWPTIYFGTKNQLFRECHLSSRCWRANLQTRNTCNEFQGSHTGFRERAFLFWFGYTAWREDVIVPLSPWFFHDFIKSSLRKLVIRMSHNYPRVWEGR